MYYMEKEITDNKQNNIRSCGRCNNYGCLTNQGYWWCNAGHTENMNPDTCGDYDSSIQDSATCTYTSTVRFADKVSNNMTPKEYGIKLCNKKHK